MKRTMWRPMQLLCVAALLAGMFGGSGASLPIAYADHTAAPTRVTIPGSLGSELGCTSGDWQPSCNGDPGSIPVTPDPLQANDLVEQGNGVWARELAVPATNAPYEYKAALNGNWDESYAGRPNVGGNTGLAITQATPVKFYYDHKTHFVADNFNQTIYTVPGSFNSELGCPGDWQPDCLRTLMSDVDGDGTYTFVTNALPAMSYEFKVATAESFSNSYGAGGGVDNIAFTVPASGLAVTISFNSATNVPTVVVAEPPAAPAEDAALIRAPAIDSGNQDEVFYFVLPDRFANGDTANDAGGVAGDTLVNGLKVDSKGYYHGGDLKGLQAKIPYLKELGVTAIWMTPLFKNKAVQCDPTVTPPTIASCSAGYHGYWITDFTQIDPHFGTNQEMRDLIAAAQGEGLRVFFDIITNHTADVIDYEGGNYAYVPRSDAPYRDASGNIIDDRDYLDAAAFPPLNRYSFPKRPIFRNAADASVKVPAWLNDVTMYHNRGNANFDGSEGDLYGDFVGLDGIFTERPEVVTGMTDIYKYWISEFGVDGFRIDTVKHVNLEFWQKFVPAIKSFAATQGKPDFFVFGEVFDGNPANLSRYTRDGQFPAVLDFDFNYSAGDFAVGSGGPGRLSGLFAGDDYYTTPDKNAYNLPTFLGNHDVGRIGSRMQTVTADLPDSERLARMGLGYSLMFTARGVPIIYYGDEQGFTGDGGDQDARQDMFASQVASYNDDDLIGSDSTTAVDNFDPAHPLYQTLKALTALRKAHPALQHGAQIERLAESGAAGVYAFSRIDRDEKIEYVVALNNAETARTVTVPTFAPGGASFAAIYGATGNVAANGAGQIGLNVPALGMVVYRQEAAAPAGGSTLGPLLLVTQPVSGSTLLDGGQLEVRAEVTGNVFAEVSFAVSINGGAFTPLGTDTNAPYRVFYNQGALPGGTQLTFKAVSTDKLGAAGNFYSATSVVTTGVPEVCTVQYEYAIVHYNRPDGNYDGWTVYPFVDGVTEPDYNTGSYPFIGRTDYGAFAFIPLDDASKQLGFVVHNNADGSDEKDPDGDRFFTPKDTPQIFLKSGDATVYSSQAVAQGFVRLHYSRDDGDYSGAVAYVFGEGAAASETSNAYPGTRAFTGSDDFGRYVDVLIGDPTKTLGFIVIKDGAKDPGDDDRLITPATTPAAWVNSGDATTYTSKSAANGVVTLRYHRPGGDYSDGPAPSQQWGLHLWAGTRPDVAPTDYFNDPFLPNLPQDSFGIGFEVPLADDATNWAYILHKGNDKDKQSDQFLNLAETGNEIWIIQNMPGEYPYLLPVEPGCRLGQGNVATKQRAHWISADTIAWPIVASPLITYTLHYAPNGGMSFSGGEVQGGSSLPLSLNTAGLSAASKAAFPQLADLTALTVNADATTAREILKGQILVSARTAEQGVIEVTGVQIPGVLDDLYATAAASQNLGPSWSPLVLAQTAQVGLKLWAPTAQDVNLLLFPDATSTATETLEMSLDAGSGVWSAAVDATREGQYYLYEVKVFVPATGQVETNIVTDPYSVSLSMNSTRSQFVNLANAALKPAGWDGMAKPRLDAFEDIVLYELHVRDFSINDTSVPEAQRGTFAAFTQASSSGMSHLRALANDGLTHIHLLPVFDIATIEEDRLKRTDIITRFAELRALPGDSEQQQALANSIRDQDGFNWGYDPYHYNVPEGSYSTDPNGTQRIVEFREMVQALSNDGLRVVMDVVYNHTNSSGQAEKSVLDRVVPGYYQRLNADGGVETSTCCANTASEHAMMEKLMIESVVQWARAYKVDGFRFDLMGHHTKANMLKLRAALDALTLANDGVDGAKIYLYGEGWNFGEVADGARGVNATQRNMAGTGIGTFSDRLRDAVRGGGPFDSGEGAKRQGFINGLFYDPNDLNQGSADDQKAALLRAVDMIKVGLAGNLASFPIVNSNGASVTGGDIDYNGSPGGYTQDPQEVITYIEAHDNETLFDTIQLKAPAAASVNDRVRMQNMGISIVMLGQGIPFFQAGQDFLRSKSGDRNSYNAGDWFNRIDWTLQENNWGSGLPIQGDNNNNWPLLRPLLANRDIKPGPPQMASAYAHFSEMLRIRKSSPLFRLHTAGEVNSHVSFLNNGPSQLPGLVVMRITDSGVEDIDPLAEQLVVFFNASDEAVSFSAAELVGANLALHPIQAGSLDATLAGATYDAATGSFSIPARTTAVFIDQSQPVFIDQSQILYLPLVANN